jgi:hypothetical protein
MKLVTIVLALLCVASTARAQQAPEADPFKFSSDAAVMIWTIKTDQTEAFESVWNVIRTRLQASTKPELKALGENLLLFKAALPPTPQGVTYVFLANPASKTTSYAVSPYLLYESGLFERPEADELVKMIQAAIAQVNPVPLIRMP